MPLKTGERLGPYCIVSWLGAGGMGEVYRAQDTRLNRAVAIKVVRGADLQRNARLFQEAQAASALNHPNIVTIHDIGSENGRDYLVMEYIAGKPLDTLIPRDGMPFGQLVRIAIQIADALSRAHAAGIVHRDLKPSNIIVSEDGVVKILDFGVAKLAEAVKSDAPGGDATQTVRPTTQEGMVLGTAGYMSPEQAEAKRVDERSDIFSFGAVIYEMATGRRAFQGDSTLSTMAAVLNTEPQPLSAAAPGMPHELERIVNRCLRKDPARRQQHMADVKVLLEDLKQDTESGTVAAQKPVRRRWPVVALGALALLAAAWFVRPTKTERAPTLIPLTTFAGDEAAPSFSPDGKQVVFAWNGEKKDNYDIYVKLIGSFNVLRLTTDPAPDFYPSWSPDGRQIAFGRAGSGRGLYVISPLGGPAQRLSELIPAGPPSWTPDGKQLIFASHRNTSEADGRVFAIPSQGGAPRSLLTPKPGSWFKSPACSPLGDSLAFASCRGLSVSYACDIELVDLDHEWNASGARRTLTNASYLSGLAWTRDASEIVYDSGPPNSNAHLLWRVPVKAGAQPERLEILSAEAEYPAIGPAGRLAVAHRRVDRDVWRVQAGGKAQPFLVSSTLDASPEFSPDGTRIAFVSGRSGERISIWIVSADNTDLRQLTNDPDTREGSPRWSPDGSRFAFTVQGPDSLWNVRVIGSSGGPARQIPGGAFSNSAPNWSRDGRWIYFASNRSGRSEIWRVPVDGGAAVQVTRDGGFAPAESADGKTLYYLKQDASGPLYARAIGGGEEKKVVDYVVNRAFAVFADGIYYIGWRSQDEYQILFYDFKNGSSRKIADLDGKVYYGFAVSPDRKVFLYTRQSSAGRDLMLVENFR